MKIFVLLQAVFFFLAFEVYNFGSEGWKLYHLNGAEAANHYGAALLCATPMGGYLIKKILGL